MDSLRAEQKFRHRSFQHQQQVKQRSTVNVNLVENQRRPESCFRFVVDCLSPSLILNPSSSNVSFPLQFRRDQDFSISSTIELNCNKSFRLGMEWTISNGSSSLLVNPSLVNLTTSELFLPPRTLPLGVYQLTLTITFNVSSNVTTSAKSTFVQINSAGVTANLVPLGTSQITRGEQQDLQFNPGLNSVDLDGDPFNASVNLPRLSFSLYSDGLIHS
jgi:hypothetical protein